jgi:hypothetical protein
MLMLILLACNGGSNRMKTELLSGGNGTSKPVNNCVAGLEYGTGGTSKF